MREGEHPGRALMRLVTRIRRLQRCEEYSRRDAETRRSETQMFSSSLLSPRLRVSARVFLLTDPRVRMRNEIQPDKAQAREYLDSAFARSRAYFRTPSHLTTDAYEPCAFEPLSYT